MKKIVVAILFLFCLTLASSAQHFALKSNLLYFGTNTPNLGMEVAFSNHITLSIAGGYNGWEYMNYRSVMHWTVIPELRYWLKEKYQGHFFGIHGTYADYDMGFLKLPFDVMKNRRYDGTAVGGGLTYGHTFRLTDRWNFELSISGGYYYMKYYKYIKNATGEPQIQGLYKNDYIGPTKASVSFVYVFR